MSQSEINDVVAAVESLVRRAYTLGRRDALRHLVKYAQSDEALAKPLALLAPVVEASAFQDGDEAKITANDPGAPIVAPDESMAPKTPPAAARRASPPASGGLGAMILDFVYPPKAS
jgi:hypothetical protein